MNRNIPRDKLLNGLPALLFNLILAVFSLFYGFQFKAHQAGFIVSYFGFATVLFVMLTLALCYAHLTGKKCLWSATSEELFSAFLPLVSILFSIHFYSEIETESTRYMLIALLCAGLMLVFTRSRPYFPVVLLLLGGVSLSYLMLITPLNYRAANMLPVIIHACGDLLQGNAPWLKIYHEVTSAVFFYLPVSVVQYCPLVAADLDVRLLNVLLFWLILLVCAKKTNFIMEPKPMLLTILPLMFSPMVLQMGFYGHVWLYWLVTVLFSFSVISSRQRITAFSLGALIALRQMGLFIAVLFGSLNFRTWGIRKSTKFTLLVTIIALALTVPWLIGTNVNVWNFYTGVNTASNVTHGGTLNPSDQIAISGFFISLGMREHMFYFQALTLFAVAGWAFLTLHSLSAEKILFVIGIGFILVVSMSAFLHRYFYVPGLLMIAVSIANSYENRKG